MSVNFQVLLIAIYSDSSLDSPHQAIHFNVHSQQDFTNKAKFASSEIYNFLANKLLNDGWLQKIQVFNYRALQ